MSEAQAAWDRVDDFVVSTLTPEDDALAAAQQASNATTMPGAQVSAAQGRFLALLVQAAGARRVLEFGTLGGYSSIWFARAVGPDGHVTTLELDENNAAIARRSLDRSGVGDRVEVVIGPAADSAARLIEEQVAPFDFVFIDADKPSNPAYLRAAMGLTEPGALIVIDNVIRGGAVTDETSTDPRVHGVRQVLADIAADARLEATALQTVGSKGWDGFALLRRIG